MTEIDAVRVFSAAQGDPVLAAWAFVLYTHRLPVSCDITPYDHLEAYQDLFTLGFVTPDAYDRTDISQTFFSGTRPSPGDLQDVLAAMEQIHPQEIPVTKAKPPMSAFSNSLATRDARELSARRPAVGLGGKVPSNSLSAFRSNSATLPATRAPAQVEAFGAPAAAFAPLASHQHSSLVPAQPSVPTVDARTYRKPGEIDCELRCCGHPLNMIDEGGDVVPAESIPHEEFSLIEFMFHAECEYCGAMFHCSVGKPIPRDSV